MRENQPKHRQAEKGLRRLARRAASRQGLPAILVICEGRETEPNYIYGLCAANRVNVAGVTIRCGEDGTDAESLVGTARRIYRDDPTFDRVFVVCDGDVDISAARRLAGQSLQRSSTGPRCVELIVSRPSIEFWLLLHFEYSTRPFRDAWEVIAQLRHHIPGYSKSDKKIFQTVASGLDRAMYNAQRLKKDLHAMGVDTPDTDMGVLVDVLLSMRRSP